MKLIKWIMTFVDILNLLPRCRTDNSNRLLSSPLLLTAMSNVEDSEHLSVKTNHKHFSSNLLFFCCQVCIAGTGRQERGEERKMEREKESTLLNTPGMPAMFFLPRTPFQSASPSSSVHSLLDRLRTFLWCLIYF